jgi:protein CpxP
MKIKLGLLVMVMFAGVITASAQGGGGGQRRTPEERTKRVVDTLTTVFKLDNTVSGQVQTAFMDYYKEQDKLREAMMNGGDRATMQPAMQKLSDDRDAKLKKVLSEEQFKKFKDEIEPAVMPRRRPQQ